MSQKIDPTCSVAGASTTTSLPSTILLHVPLKIFPPKGIQCTIDPSTAGDIFPLLFLTLTVESLIKMFSFIQQLRYQLVDLDIGHERLLTQLPRLLAAPERHR